MHLWNYNENSEQHLVARPQAKKNSQQQLTYWANLPSSG